MIKVTHSLTCVILLIYILNFDFLQESTAMSEESEGEAAATANGDEVQDSSAKRRLRNRRLNLNKLARYDFSMMSPKITISSDTCRSFTFFIDITKTCSFLQLPDVPACVPVAVLRRADQGRGHAAVAL